MSIIPCSCHCCEKKNKQIDILVETLEERKRYIEQLKGDVQEARAEAKHAKIQLSIFKISGQECRNKENV